MKKGWEDMLAPMFCCKQKGVSALVVERRSLKSDHFVLWVQGR
eukprot:COSAG03_NODE_1594_length_3816_cov_3.513586_5_plen_43_part_00